ncbi:methyl-accepting chemotaxis protein [Thorsellia anophelis]|uniref:Methyl-accepting chemotaxis protein n=1 Tax=Thorsellia anophelis DSM 18579 TaxID=1123402 RepID=A0A1H9YVM5_9GAMM|nr:methyl-accepting chemotaxis protein [Thorsellia anophelis]SES72724.1 methyl-accepting chemotaxis protein [Thorsellia anophelis DSM 18579]
MRQGPFSSVKSKILVGFSLIIAMIFVVAITSILRVNSIADSLLYVDSFNSVKQRHAINFRGSVHDRAIAARDIILVETSSEVPQVVDTINKLAKDYADAHVALNNLLKERADEVQPIELEILKRIDDIEKQTLPLIDEVIKHRLDKNYARAEIVMMEKARPLFVEWLKVINEFIDLQEKSSVAETQKALATAESFQAAMLLLLAIATVIGLSSAFIVARVITRSLGDEPGHVSSIANDIASGNLAISIDSNSADPDSVIVAIANMRDGLSNMISNVRDSSEHIEQAADLIDKSNVSLSVRTDQQASSLSQIADSMTHLTNIVQLNTQSARQATEKAESASSVAVKGGAVISEMVTTMASINESSRKVADITSVIDGIAFQTNILALNAAVEAARAGEHGRGFAVVATEVRNLAQRSATAAKEIEGLIADSVQRVNSGNQLAAQAGTSISDIVDSVHEVTQIISQITASSEEQSSGIHQVGALIQQMDDITHLNLSMVREANDATHTMKQQIVELSKLVAAFKMFDSEAYKRSHNAHVQISTTDITYSPNARIESKKSHSNTKSLPKVTTNNSIDNTPIARKEPAKTATPSHSEKGSKLDKVGTATRHEADTKKDELKRPKVYNLGGQEVKSPTGAPNKKQENIVSDHEDWEEF